MVKKQKQEKEKATIKETTQTRKNEKLERRTHTIRRALGSVEVIRLTIAQLEYPSGW